MKKVIFFILGAAITFIVISFAMRYASSDFAIYIAAACALFGGLVGSGLAKKSKEESEKTGAFAKIIIWILVIAIIIVAVIVFIGLN